MERPLSVPTVAKCLQTSASTSPSLRPVSSRFRGSAGRNVSPASRAEIELKISWVVDDAMRRLDLAEAALFDRRGAARHACDGQPFWRIAGEGLPETSVAGVRDVSATGIGLCVKQPLKPGTVFVLTLQADRQRLSRPLPVRVMHATPQADGGWLLGCQFVRRLSDPDLQALLGGE
jgi:hypothetical protein